MESGGGQTGGFAVRARAQFEKFCRTGPAFGIRTSLEVSQGSIRFAWQASWDDGGNFIGAANRGKHGATANHVAANSNRFFKNRTISSAMWILRSCGISSTHTSESDGRLSNNTGRRTIWCQVSKRRIGGLCLPQWSRSPTEGKFRDGLFGNPSERVRGGASADVVLMCEPERITQ